MPRLAQMERRETAVYWAKTGIDDNNEPILASPIEIRVRWERVRDNLLKPDNTNIVILANVVVDRVMGEGDQLWLGTLDDWYQTGSAGDETEIMMVRKYSRTPDMKVRTFRHVVGLSYFRDTRP